MARIAASTNLLGTTVRQQRKAAELTQRELGELAGTGIIFISQLERGKQTVRLDKLLSVLKVLGLELNIIRGRNSISVSRELVRK